MTKRSAIGSPDSFEPLVVYRDSLLAVLSHDIRDMSLDLPLEVCEQGFTSVHRLKALYTRYEIQSSPS